MILYEIHVSYNANSLNAYFSWNLTTALYEVYLYMYVHEFNISYIGLDSIGSNAFLLEVQLNRKRCSGDSKILQ
jgi:hypothetical protein